MKFTLSWLKSHLETDAGADEVAQRLTMLGLEVEEVVDRSKELSPFVVGYVVEAKKHPNADTLSVCLVESGSGTPTQVVCGAPNARTGMKGVFAPAGVTIPGTGLALKSTKIRGVESNGMLCSEREMGLGEDHAGIIDLPADAPVGEAFAKYIGLDDPVFDVAVLPNRQDCLGVRGIARDLAAAGLGSLKPLEVEAVPGAFASPLDVRFDFAPEVADACPLFVGRYLRGVKNGPSPAWLQERLRSIGLNPISTLVDLTNFITFDVNRPLHVFDADKVKGDLVVSLAKGGEKVLALNGKEYELDGQVTVIGDETGALALGGVIGGESSGCDESTTNVFIEAALFDPVRTAATGRRLAIESDARYRFERGVDPDFVVAGMEMMTRLVLELCGGEASELVITGRAPAWQREVELRPERLRTLGGIDVPAEESARILAALGFGVAKSADRLRAAVPSWRLDIEGEADLVEEVTRVYGFDRVPSVPMTRATPVTRVAISPLERRGRTAKRALAARGMTEVVTWSFLPQRHAELFGGGGATLGLANPISADLDWMRPSIVPNLIAACGRNVNRGFENLAFFEVGPCYQDDTPEGQTRVAAGVRRGSAGERHWAQGQRPVDAYDAEADARAALAACGAPVASLQVMADAPDWYHPGRSGTLRLGPGNVLAAFGDVHPKILAELDVRGPVVAFEVFLDAIPLPKAKASRTRPPLTLRDFQPVERDFAFVVDQEVPADKIVRAAAAADRKLVARVSVFDVYEGEGVPDGKKSVAIAVRLEPGERTLTEADIEQVADKVVAQVTKATGGTLRS